jgi:hypothetical protein
MTTTTSSASTAVAVAEPVFSSQERLSSARPQSTLSSPCSP